jgi:cytochrome c oxidase cbb3-type subunit III
LAKQHCITWRIAWIVVVLISAWVICPAQTLASKSSSGRRTFEAICASCHGLNGKGGERGPDIAGRLEIVKLSDGQLFKILHDGKPQGGMPGFGGLGTAKLTEVLGYLRSLQGKRATPAIALNVGNGKEFFSGKGGCSGCHMVHGSGGFIGPDLSDYGATHSADDIRNAILDANKRPGFNKALAKATTKDGKQLSGLVRNEDNFSVQLQSLNGTFHLLEKSDLAELTFESAPLMPSDYGSRFTQVELKQVVAYLISVGNVQQDQQAATGK